MKPFVRSTWFRSFGTWLLSTSSCFTSSLLSDEANARNWPSWRGAHQNGQASPAAKPPIRWDSKINLQWSTDFLSAKGPRHQSFGRTKFLCSSGRSDRSKEREYLTEDERSKTISPDVYYRFHVNELDRTSGVRLARVATEQVPHEGHHETHTYAGGSPTTDGERLYVLFASRGFYCYSLSGELLWEVDLGDMRTRFGWGDAVTPVLAGDALIINWDQEENSFLVSLDKRTGKILWKVGG